MMDDMSAAITRRGVCASSLFTAALAGAAVKTKKPLGFQLYTIRALLPEKARPALEALAAAGYREIETLRATHSTILPLCKEFGLKPVSAHFETGIVTGNEKAWFPQGKPYGWDRCIEEAKNAGLKFMVIPYVRPDERGGPDVYKKMAADLNRAGEACQKAGLRLCYHHHAFEFGPVQGQRPIDILLNETDAKNLALEMDVFWVAIAGEDPVAWMKKLKGRVPLLHLKDRAPGAPMQFAEGLSPAAFREVGYGTLDFKSILAAAPGAGVENYLVEQDQVAGDPVESLKASLTYLAKLGL
jgi:sugar phosphate isomerase/epimerase